MINKKTEKDWNYENINNFWNWFAQNPYLQNKYFSKQVGVGIVSLLKGNHLLKGKILDYGCGPGYLIERMLEIDNVEVYGFEFSEKSIKTLNNKFNNFPNFIRVTTAKNIPTPFESNFFDVITSVEMIEHLKDESIPIVLRELKRLIKPSGIIFITTPNNENLESNMIFCPFCNSEFHRVQHMRSFNEENLKQLFIKFGFKILFCKAINLHEFQKPRIRITDITIYEIYQMIKEFVKKIKYRFSFDKKKWSYELEKKYDNPKHLICIISK